MIPDPGSLEEARLFAAECAEAIYADEELRDGVCEWCGEPLSMASILLVNNYGPVCSERCLIRAERSHAPDCYPQ